MRHLKRHRQSIVAGRAFGFMACLVLCAMLPAAAQTPDESALRTLVERFFAAYQKEEVVDMMALWSKDSPERAATEQAMRRTFVENQKIQLHSLAILGIKVEGDKASARVLIDVSAVEAKTGRPATGFGKLSRTLQFVKEGGLWKVWRYVSGEEGLADELVSARTGAERQALLEARKESVTDELVRGLVGRGMTLFSRGDFAAALDIADLALNVARRIDYRAGVAGALRLTGNVHTMRGEYTRALEYYQKSLEVAEELGDKLSIAGSLNNLGNVYDLMGDGARAADYFQRALSISIEMKYPRYQAIALNNLANIYDERGDHLRSLEYYQKSLNLAEELGDQESLSRALFNIGGVHESQGNYQQALEFYRKSLAIKEDVDKAGVPRLLGNIGLVYFRLGDYDLALDYYRKALKRAEELGDKEVIAGTTTDIGNVYAAKGDYGQALAHIRSGIALAEAIGNKALAAGGLRDLGVAYLQVRDYQKAVEYADRAAALALESGQPTFLWLARTVAGKANLALRRFDLARRSLLEAISTVEELRGMVAGGEQQRERFFENKVEPYYAMVDLSLAQGNYYEALDYGDRAKSRVLADVLSSGRADITKAMTVEEQGRERALNNRLVAINRQVYQEKTMQQPDAARLSDLNAQLQKARLEYEAFETSLYAAHPELKLQRGQAPTLTPERIGELLPDAKTALLEFVVRGEQPYLFVLTRGPSRGPRGRVELKTYRLSVKGSDLAARVKEFRRRLAERDPEFRESARGLYDLLIKPAAVQLQGKTMLGIIPDGDLWELPFQALQPREDSYLIEDHALFYAPSLGVLYGIEHSPGKRRAGVARRATPPPVSPGRPPARPAPASGSRRRAPTLLAFGNPAIGQGTVARLSSIKRDERLGPLPEAEREVKTLGEIYKPENSRVYIGSNARETLAKAMMGDYSVLHFATHGVLDDLNPMYSHLVLSLSGDDKGEDGLLHASEVMRLNLSADIVVLSACQTARGRVGAGEGVLGMSWALFIAGSPTTVASQWSVESSSTTQLMVEFHRNLLSSATPGGPGLPKAEALRRASLSLLKNSRYAHPFYWAGFVMVGDGMSPLQRP